jgi:hypothetical protein
MFIYEFKNTMSAKVIVFIFLHVIMYCKLS